MAIEDVFSITGRGTVSTGRIERGIIKVGDNVEIVGIGETQSTTITGIEMFQKTLDEGFAGDNVGILLRGTTREEIQRGMVLAQPGTITPHTTFESEVYVLTNAEGGRSTPFFAGYRPQFYVRTTDVTGAITQFTSDDGTPVEMVMPGDRIKMTAELTFNHELLNSSCKKMISILQNMKLNSVKTIKLPTRKRIYCLLRSPHVDKDSREHFEIRTHKRILEIYFNSSVSENLFDLLVKIDLPSGVLYKLEMSN